MNRQTLSSIIKLFAISTNKREDINLDIISARFNDFLTDTIESKYIDEFRSDFEKALEEYASFSSKRLSLNSVRMIRICSETCKTLSADDRITVLFYLVKLLSSTRDKQSNDFIELVCDIYEIDKNKLECIQNIFSESPNTCHTITHEGKIAGIYAILSENLAAIKPIEDSISINGQKATGVKIIGIDSTITINDNKKLYFNDLQAASKPIEKKKTFEIAINNLSVSRKHKILLHPLSCKMKSGELVGVMGRSGSGKTTMLKALAGIDNSFTGNINCTFSRAYLPQANSLIPLFKVKEHLEQRLDFIQYQGNREAKIAEVLTKVELAEFANNIAAKSDGSSWQISGGQQKRLGIAIEMLNDPEVFILDEPTSGLSSTDSHKIISLLKKIAMEQKIVVASIHQPDYETFMMFDKILLIDDGGFPIFYGSPTFAADYFRQKAGKIDKESLLETHFNPGVILNIINEKSHDEHGNSTGKRLVSPKEWNCIWQESQNENIDSQANSTNNRTNISPQNGITSFCKQLKFSFRCDFKNKLRISIIAIIAPIMSVTMSLLTRFSLSDDYSYFSNPNIPAWLMMLLITGFFLGLVISGHEFIFLRQFHKNEHIICDKSRSLALAKITKYLIYSGGISLLLTLPATIIADCPFLFGNLFIIIWLLTFCGCLISMIMSVFFKTISAVYLLIPLIVIPQMIFSGGLIQYEHFNKLFVKSDGLPIFASIMPIRWADEACMTDAYFQNPIEKEIFNEKIEFYKSVEIQDNERKQITQAKIDNILESIENCDSINKLYSNMYITKIVNTCNENTVIPPIYNTKDDNDIFLCGQKKLFGNTISTYNYNALILLLYNLILCIGLVCCVKFSNKLP